MCELLCYVKLQKTNQSCKHSMSSLVVWYHNLPKSQFCHNTSGRWEGQVQFKILLIWSRRICTEIFSVKIHLLWEVRKLQITGDVCSTLLQAWNVDFPLLITCLSRVPSSCLTHGQEESTLEVTRAPPSCRVWIELAYPGLPWTDLILFFFPMAFHKPKIYLIKKILFLSVIWDLGYHYYYC